MLLWMPPSSPPAAGTTHPDDIGEKGDKIRRRAAQVRARNVLMVVGLFLLAFFATFSQVQYTSKRKHENDEPGGSLRIANDKAVKAVQTDVQEDVPLVAEEAEAVEQREAAVENEESADDFFVPHAHLPENSIYRLQMEDVTGNSIDLGQFSGMVSLVVNTACH
jgi:hypothetical protein